MLAVLLMLFYYEISYLCYANVARATLETLILIFIQIMLVHGYDGGWALVSPFLFVNHIDLCKPFELGYLIGFHCYFWIWIL